MTGVDTIIDSLELDLIQGRARLIADLNEFFRDVRVGDTVFSLLAKGRTRNRGLFLSRFFSWTALPDYSVSLFCCDEGRAGRFTVDRLRGKMEIVSQAIEREGLHWSWLILFSDMELPASTVAFVSRYDRRELGLAVVSTSSAQTVFSNNQVGRSIGKHLGLKKLLRKLNRENVD